ncbi:MAG: dTMP kinase [Myxococcales bacterium]|nr:MAG: dTMP kinase [Myxococcales bacterium]
MIEGHFIVIEGIDGAGTTTHSTLLAKLLRAKGLPVFLTHQPSQGPVGAMLRQVLTGRLVVPGVQMNRPPTWSTMALLFAADRMDHLQAEIIPNLKDGVTVICDRYDYSSVAYQSLSAGDVPGAAAWVRDLNRFARRPDLSIVIDVTPEEAARRRLSRMVGRELYDEDELQKDLASFYLNIHEHFPKDTIRHVAGDRSIEEVRAEILEQVNLLRGETG